LFNSIKDRDATGIQCGVDELSEPALVLVLPAAVCLCTRGKLPQCAAYEEQLPAAASNVTTAATSGSDQQQAAQAQLIEQQNQQQQEPAAASTSDPTAPHQTIGEQQQRQQPQDVQQQQQQQVGNGLPVLIGITNLYFIKMLPQWPNVVSVSKKESVSR
jgi:hypothetical protein